MIYTPGMIVAAEAGGKVLKKYFGESLETIQKSNLVDFRTKADLESEAAILAELSRLFPTYTLFSEEQGLTDKGSPFSFYIDPLDGTNNFVLGIPNFSISIGLLHHQEIIAGVIHVPIINETYICEKGKGAYRGEQRLTVSTETVVERSTLSTINYYGKSKKQYSDLFHHLIESGVKRIINNWSPAYDFCLLASGRIEGIINNNSELYDFAAGKLLVREAGALVTDFAGTSESNDQNTRFIASSGEPLHSTLVTIAQTTLL